MHTLSHQQNDNSMGSLVGSMVTAAPVSRAWLNGRYGSTAKAAVGRGALHTAQANYKADSTILLPEQGQASSPPGR